MKTFYSDYANVSLIEEKQVVLLEWKQAAYLENYREPTEFALKLLQEHPGTNFVVDARNGFEDDKRDVEWGFSYLLPEMAKTSCRCICFIMNQVNDIEAEMDMWTLEFGKYFGVMRAEDFEQAVELLQHFILADVTYTIKSGKRAEFLDKLKEAEILQCSRREPGNIKYEVCIPVDADDEVCLIEYWTNKAAQGMHAKTAHYAKLTELKAQYVEAVNINCYQV